MRIRDAFLDLSPRQVRRLSSIYVDGRNATVTFSIHLYDGLRSPVAEDVDGILAMQLSRVPDVIVQGCSACDSPQSAVEQLQELSVEWVGTLSVAKFEDSEGWRVLAKTHSQPDELRRWLLESRDVN